MRIGTYYIIYIQVSIPSIKLPKGGQGQHRRHNNEEL